MEIVLDDVLFEIDRAGAVQRTGLGDEYGGGVLALGQEFLPDGVRALFGPWDFDALLFEVGPNDLRIPDREVTQHPHDLLLPHEPAGVQFIGELEVHADAAPPHVEENWRDLAFKIHHLPEIFAGEDGLQFLPDIQCVLGVRFTVGSDEAGREFPEVGFDISEAVVAGRLT